MAKTFRGGSILGIRIPTVFTEVDAIVCEGCRDPIKVTPFRVSIMDSVSAESPPSWATYAAINPGPHQFHSDPEHFWTWARANAYFRCRLAVVREVMRPVPLPGETVRWGLCDGDHQEAHQFVPA